MTESQLHQLSIAVGEKLRDQGLWLTCAESCTGGWVAKAITDIAGSSAYFSCGFVTYSNRSKQELLGVAEQTLVTWGAVSEEVVCAMAQGALRVADADLALSVSGIAGPDGGSDDKPVGTVWFGFAHRSGRVETRRRQFSGDRAAVRLQAAIVALQILRDEFL